MDSPFTSSKSPLLPSFRRQQLLLEYASLKHHCPEGIYITLNPDDVSSWTGVYFVREGAYASAILRFAISFPQTYPEVLPSMTFSTEIFHPLLVPLTTYTYSAGAIDATETISSSDTDRLAPGSLNLKHGFPRWSLEHTRGRQPPKKKDDDLAMHSTDDDPQSETTAKTSNQIESRFANQTGQSPIVSILRYLKASFEDPSLLDSLPVEASGNQSAWHAWRSYRGLSKPSSRPASPSGAALRATGSSRNPADWNWDGLWEARVRTNIDESMSDAQLFGSKTIRNIVAASDPIRFARLDDEKLESIQTEMMKAHLIETPTLAQ